MDQPSEKGLHRMRVYVQKYWEKSGSFPHPDKEVTEAVGLTGGRGLRVRQAPGHLSDALALSYGR